jgi:hypothetical protein
MLNFVLGFFREYWPVVLTCAIARFVIPPVVDWLVRFADEKALRDEAERHTGAD